MIERLQFDEDSTYEAIEAAIHLSRYSVASNFCPGRRVLDIACGQGYGSFLMRQQWGADQVEGIDIDPDTIETAARIFAADGIRYQCHPCERIDELFDEESFDLIVCLETIEHVNDPNILLHMLKRHLAPEGIIILSCPNDYWYYPTEQEGNPFHMHKFRFTEFRDLTQEVLGKAHSFLFGVPVNGFTHLAINDQYLLDNESEDSRLAIQRRTKIPECEMLRADEHIDDSNCCYFTGIWAPSSAVIPKTSVIFPLSMNASVSVREHENVKELQNQIINLKTFIFKNQSYLSHANSRINLLNEELSVLKTQSANQITSCTSTEVTSDKSRNLAYSKDEYELRTLGLRAKCFQKENEYLKSELRILRNQIEKKMSHVGYGRRKIKKIKWIKRFIPGWAKTILKHMLYGRR